MTHFAESGNKRHPRRQLHLTPPATTAVTMIGTMMGDHTPAEPTAARMPTVFLSHGAPWLADDPIWTKELAAWSGNLPKPSSILVVSAHWEAAPLMVGATETVPLYYDFYGFAPSTTK